jgi:hypothetical protein
MHAHVQATFTRLISLQYEVPFEPGITAAIPGNFVDMRPIPPLGCRREKAVEEKRVAEGAQRRFFVYSNVYVTIYPIFRSNLSSEA